MLAAALALAAPVAAQDTTLRLAHYGSAADTVTAAAERFAELVSEKTDGAVAVEVFPNGELGDSPTMLEGARLGTIDITTVGNPYFTGFLPELNLLDLPFLFESDAHAFAVLDGEVGRTLMDGMQGSGLQGLAFWELGFRNLTNSVRPIEGPAALEGLKLRTTPNPAHVLAFETLGANPTPMPFAEVLLGAPDRHDRRAGEPGQPHPRQQAPRGPAPSEPDQPRLHDLAPGDERGPLERPAARAPGRAGGGRARGRRPSAPAQRRGGGRQPPGDEGRGRRGR